MTTTTTAAAIAAGLREHLRDRITYLPDRKLHALLYLAQGLALVDDGTPLFREPLVATEHGVQVEFDDQTSPPVLGDVEFGIVAVTAGRYGGLSAMDLEALIRGQGPWSTTTPGHALDLAAVRQVFRDQADTPEGTITGIPRSARAGQHPPFGADQAGAAKPDSPEEIAAFIADVKARM